MNSAREFTRAAFTKWLGMHAMTRVSAGPYTLALPANGVAILYEDGRQLPGGVGYLDALVQFAGEVIRLNAEIVALQEMREAVFREGMEHAARVDRAMLDNAQRVGATEALERHDRLVIKAVAVATPAIRAEALEEAARLHEYIDPACDHERQNGTPGAAAMGAIIRYRDAIRALKEPEV